MNQTDLDRIAVIRMEVAKWQALTGAAKNWDNAFLLSVIDKKNQEIAELKKIKGASK